MRIKHLLIDSFVCLTSPNCLSEGVNATEREVYWDVSRSIKHVTGFMLYRPTDNNANLACVKV